MAGSQAEGTILRRNGKTIPLSFHPAVRLEPAPSHPLDCRHRLETQTGKRPGARPLRSGSSPWSIRGTCSHRWQSINALRRDLFRVCRGTPCRDRSLPSRESVAHAEGELRLKLTGHPEQHAGDHASPVPLRLAVYSDTLAGVGEAVRAGADAIYYEPDIPREAHVRHTGPARAVSCLHGDSAGNSPALPGQALSGNFPGSPTMHILDTVLPALAGLYTEGLTDCMAENHGTAVALRRALAEYYPLRLHRPQYLQPCGGAERSIFLFPAHPLAGTLAK